MRAVYLFVAFIGFTFTANALNCRTDGGPKEEELKSIYMNCMKSQDGRNSTNSRGYYDENSSREKRKHQGGSLNSRWDRKDDVFGSRDDWSSGGDWSRTRDRNTGTSGRDNWSDRDDKGSNRYDKMGSSRTGSSNRGNGRDDYNMETDEYGSDMRYSNNNNGRMSPPSRRFKRERSSGHRSQYNPNTSKSSKNNFDDSNSSNDKNSSENNSSKDTDNKACALHCFLEELEMTGENGMPDRYLVTQVVTKDVKNEDLRDFLQESIEECFQILYNENTQDQCEFSKNLMMCLSEKGRANCDDWKDDIKL